MLRPMIHAPTFAKPREAKSSSMPGSPPSPPCMLRKVLVSTSHSCSCSPPEPSGCSTLWLAPAPYPSSEIENDITRTFIIQHLSISRLGELPASTLLSAQEEPTSHKASTDESLRQPA